MIETERLVLRRWRPEDAESLFEYANYTGFDLYDGVNVEVVGDAHNLSQYFDKQYDLIFCSAVFEHFAMPWIVACIYFVDSNPLPQ